MRVELNGRVYPTKKAMKMFFKDILYKYDDGCTISEDDKAHVLALLYYHPNALDKVGTGVDHINIEIHDSIEWGRGNLYPHFQLYRTDGTNIDFSYAKTIPLVVEGEISPEVRKEQQSKCREDSVMNAMRSEISDIKQQFKKEQFEQSPMIICPYTNIPVDPSTAQVYLAGPHGFPKMVGDYIDIVGVDINDIEITTIDGINNRIEDSIISKGWAEYYAKNAKLVITHFSLHPNRKIK